MNFIPEKARTITGISICKDGSFLLSTKGRQTIRILNARDLAKFYTKNIIPNNVFQAAGISLPFYARVLNAAHVRVWKNRVAN